MSSRGFLVVPTIKIRILYPSHGWLSKLWSLFLGPYYSTGPNTGPNLGDPFFIILTIPHMKKVDNRNVLIGGVTGSMLGIIFTFWGYGIPYI